MDIRNEHKCRVCNEEFDLITELLQHLKNHVKSVNEGHPVKDVKVENLPNKDKKFKCNLCAKEFNFERNMREHKMYIQKLR